MYKSKLKVSKKSLPKLKHYESKV